MALPDAHVRHRPEFDIRHEWRQHFGRPWPLHRDHRPLLGNRGQPDPQVGEFGLQVVFHMLQHERGAACGRGDMEPVGGEAGDDAVVTDETIFAQQHGVAAPSWRQVGEVTGVDTVQERRRRPGRRPRSCPGCWRPACRHRCARPDIRGPPRHRSFRRRGGSSAPASRCRRLPAPRPAWRSVAGGSGANRSARYGPAKAPKVTGV